MKKTYNELVKSQIFYRVLTVTLGSFIALLVFTINIEEEKITELEYKEQSVQLRIEEVKRQKDLRIMELQSANEALIKVCNPSAFRDVAKHTPLPKMKRV